MSLSQFIIRLKAEEKTRHMVVRARANPAEVFRQPRRPEYEKREANLKALAEEYQPEHRMEYLNEQKERSSHQSHWISEGFREIDSLYESLQAKMMGTEKGASQSIIATSATYLDEVNR
uniref:Uncharacterized protein n=1 Tax=Ditylenchus dipsaci TaxID=166011 RepID=A0A915EIQ2_9BILA